MVNREQKIVFRLVPLKCSAHCTEADSIWRWNHGCPKELSFWVDKNVTCSVHRQRKTISIANNSNPSWPAAEPSPDGFPFLDQKGSRLLSGYPEYQLRFAQVHLFSINVLIGKDNKKILITGESPLNSNVILLERKKKENSLRSLHCWRYVTV